MRRLVGEDRSGSGTEWRPGGRMVAGPGGSGKMADGGQRTGSGSDRPDRYRGGIQGRRGSLIWIGWGLAVSSGALHTGRMFVFKPESGP